MTVIGDFYYFAACAACILPKLYTNKSSHMTLHAHSNKILRYFSIMQRSLATCRLDFHKTVYPSHIAWNAFLPINKDLNAILHLLVLSSE